MFPPSQGYSFDIETLSGVLGSVSIACWVVVFSPQIIENYKQSSAEGLSIEFIIIWLAGDVFNILGAVLQGVLPTMIVLAIYYTLADIVLLVQCFYYRGFTLRSPEKDEPVENGANERTALVSNENADTPANDRHRSQSAYRERIMGLDATHLSPATPMHPAQPEDATIVKTSQPRTWTQAIFFNSTVVVLVIVSGIVGYYLSPSTPQHDSHGNTPADEQMASLQFNLWGQIFGYICAVLYLGSRVPQLILNARRKSTDGLNALFFIFAVLGNASFTGSVLLFEPLCSRHQHGHWHESHCKPGEASAIYARYILVNLSWIIGSLGTLFLDAAVFAQFFMYREKAQEVNVAADAMPRNENGEGRGREPIER